MQKKNNLKNNQKSENPRNPKPPPATQPAPQKPKPSGSFVVMATDNEIVTSKIKTTRELYMEKGND